MSIEMTTSRRRVVSIESIRKANQNMIEGKSALNNKDLPDHIKEEIRRRHYSVEEINAAYGRTLARMTG